MYEYHFEFITLSPERRKNPDALFCDHLDYIAVIQTNAKQGWRYIETKVFSPYLGKCIMTFERPKTP